MRIDCGRPVLALLALCAAGCCDSTGTGTGGNDTGTDSVIFTSAGTIAAAQFGGVSHIERITLANGTNSLTIPAALAASATEL